MVTHCVNREGDVPGMSLCTHMNISMNSLWVLGMRPDVVQIGRGLAIVCGFLFEGQPPIKLIHVSTCRSLWFRAE